MLITYLDSVGLPKKVRMNMGPDNLKKEYSVEITQN